MTCIKTQEYISAQAKGTQLLRSVVTYSCNIRKIGEQGSILLLFLPWILLLFTLLTGLYLVGTHVENSLALEARLDVCALEIVHERTQLMEYLVDSNAALLKIRIIIDAMRGTKVIPIVGELSTISEPALVELANTISLSQEAKILKEGILEIRRLRCDSTNFSNSFSACNFTSLARNQFHRETTIFPDVPGRISLSTENSKLTEIRCSGAIYNKLYSSKVALLGDAKLYQRNFSYAYE